MTTPSPSPTDTTVTTVTTDAAIGEGALLGVIAVVAALDPAVAPVAAVLAAVVTALGKAAPDIAIIAEKVLAEFKGQQTDTTPLAPQIEADTAARAAALNTPIGGGAS